MLLYYTPQNIIDKINQTEGTFGIAKIQLIEILEKPFYEMKFQTGDKQRLVIANAVSGEIRPSSTKEEAEKIAVAVLINPLKIKETLYLSKENMSGHHEFRNGVLPVWAVTFDSPDDLTVYVTAENGQISSFRTNEWRVFDFFWMLHTMDYKERDNINNYLLRTFSVLGIITILSGFILFFASSPPVKRSIATILGRH